MNTELSKNAKNDFKKDFLKLMNNAVFEKSYKKCQKKHRACKYRNNNKLFCVRSNYQTTKKYLGNLLIE